MKNILDLTGQEISICKTPKVKGCKPVGTQVLVELLTAQEILGTTLELATSSAKSVDASTPQAYIVDFGPGFEAAFPHVPIKKGDRVLFSGSGVFVPKYDDSGRDRFLLEPHSIKGILID